MKARSCAGAAKGAEEDLELQLGVSIERNSQPKSRKRIFSIVSWYIRRQDCGLGKEHGFGALVGS